MRNPHSTPHLLPSSSTSSTEPVAQSAQTIEQSVRDSLESYFLDLDGETPCGMYDMLIRLVEKPLLDVVMAQADGNQSRAAEWLGLNRNTLRKKLLEHQML